ncbi:biotin synthase BioB [Amycolatopsis sp. cmx-4-68]|uniref:biotin synthase BioB n=1 Tax=Amycolatopsis sp. cmx-4-68 TaxID=2790938 RepID=UPI00397D7C90
MNDWLSELAAKAIQGRRPTRDEAMTVLGGEDELLEVIAAASLVRRHFFARRVKLNTIINLKSGLCPEDCSYCSQRLGSRTDILKYSWISPADAAVAAGEAVRAGAKRVCLVASGRGPSNRDITRIEETISAIKAGNPAVEVCVCLGLLADGQAERLAAAGAHAYNHNVNTSEGRYSEICSTHTFTDRVTTLHRAAKAGLSPCSGAIFGLGESDEDIVEVARSLRDLDPDSVPVNFLIPFPGTPLAGRWDLTPHRCLRILALLRFYFPDVEVRLADGREIHLRSQQSLALHLVNSIFLGDYMTSEGQPGTDDRQLITDAGFQIEGVHEQTLPAARHDLVVIRRRGPGTGRPANA